MLDIMLKGMPSGASAGSKNGSLANAMNGLQQGHGKGQKLGGAAPADQVSTAPIYRRAAQSTWAAWATGTTRSTNHITGRTSGHFCRVKRQVRFPAKRPL